MPVTIAVASGKGGVGKSTVALNLAVAFGERCSGVGLLDADLYGPDIPRMVGLARSHEARYLDLWSASAGRLEPLERFGVRIMSAGFLVGEGQSLSLAAGLVDLLILRLSRGVDWGGLDYLLVDLPPGTADLQQQLMERVPLDGVVLVVTPQDVAHLDAKKVLDLCRRSGVRVLGAVENMSGMVCPCCGEQVEVFPRVVEQRSIWAQGVPRLAQIPLDPSLAASGDAGEPFCITHPSSAPAMAFRELAERLRVLVE